MTATVLNLNAVDPGGRSGFAHCIIPASFPLPAHEMIIEAFNNAKGHTETFDGPPLLQAQHIYWKLKELTDFWPKPDVRDIVACEDFIAPSTHRTANVLVPHKVASMLEYQVWIETMGAWDIEWRYQQPQERMIITDDNLRDWGLWKPGKKHKDEMAALKHLIVLARKLEKNNA